jgi:hypothetical protein
MDPDGNHLTAREVDAYRKRTMVGAARRRADGHLAGCAICMDLLLDEEGPDLAVARLSEAFLASDEPAFHMSAEDVASYAAGSLDEADRVAFESHLEACPECNGAIGSLRVSSSTGRRKLPGVDSKSWNRVAVAKSWIGHRPARYLAGIAALLVILLLAWASWRSSMESRRAQQAGATDQMRPAAAAQGAGGGARDDRPATSGQNEEGEPGQSLAMSLKDGDNRVGLDKQGNLVGLGALSQPDETAIRAVLESGQMSKPAVLRQLTGAPIKLMDRSSEGLPFKPISPVKTTVVDDRPEFVWESLAGAASYSVSVFDENFEMVVRSDAQTGTRWRAPIRLRRGHVYSWEVIALKDGQAITAPSAPAPRSRFKVLRPAELEELNDAKKREPRSHLALAVICARMGLVREAEAEFDKLANDNPDSELARKVVAEVKSWRYH